MSSPALSNTLEAALLNHAMGLAAYSAPSNIYLALLTAAPTSQTTLATMTEIAYTGYARQAIPMASLNAAAMNGTIAQVTNSAAITFATCTGGSATPLYWAIVDAASGTTGRILWFGAVSNQYPIANGITFSVPVGDLVFQLPTANGLAQYAALKLLDLSTGKAAWTMPTAYAALCTASSATTYTEVSYTGYGTTRPSATAQCAAATAPATAVAASVTNSVGPISFPAITASPPASISNYALLDSATVGAGNLLFWQTASTGVSPAVGYSPQINTSALQTTLQ